MSSSDANGPIASGDTANKRARVVPTPDSEEPRGIEKGIADADKQARTGSRKELVRNIPPAGAWNDTASD